jgi:putative ABC transport system permease protein
MMTQGVFGVLTLLVCAFLVVNLINAMLARQVREIGIMKTLGAGNGTIAAIYLAFALLLGAVSSAVALPLALVIGREYATFKTEMLNFPIAGFATPAWIVVVQFLAGCLLPVAAAAWPVLRGCCMPVAAALRDVGIAGDVSQRRIAGFGIARPLLLSMNNAFRKRGRLLMTLAALAIGGAVYLGAATLRIAVAASVDELFASQNFDFALLLDRGLPRTTLESIAVAAPGITRAEAWSSTRTRRVDGAGLERGNLRLIGIPPDSVMFTPRIAAGRWLGANDQRSVVVSEATLRDDPAMTPGAKVILRINEALSEWSVVGVVASGPEKIAYAPIAVLTTARADASATALVLTTTERGIATQLDAIRGLRAALEDAGARVASSQRIAESKRIAGDHLLMAVEFLGVMGWIMILVGGVGLASTMGLAVLERTREIGVLRAIGARHRDILGMIEVEGVVIGVLAWLIALPLSVPIGMLIGSAFGRMMFPVSVAYLPDAGTTLTWLVIVLAISLLASLWPALRAMRVPTAAALAYE